uniref:Putative secreted protein n=1 Tax=Anopheles darlingi TaxID=43151 RepID=A0A2M4D6H8_ANODA
MVTTTVVMVMALVTRWLSLLMAAGMMSMMMRMMLVVMRIERSLASGAGSSTRIARTTSGPGGRFTNFPCLQLRLHIVQPSQQIGHDV